MRSTPYDFIQLIKEVIMPGKTATLPDVDKTLKNARVELKTSPDAKNKLREAAQAVGVDLSAFIWKNNAFLASYRVHNLQKLVLSD